jgi:UDP-glucose 4-epimerase
MLSVMSSICITGIGGYLGLATAYKLVEEGYSVVGIGSNATAPENLPPAVVYAGIDIRDVSALAEFFTTHEVTTVYHFAAIKYVGKCETDPDTCYAVNTSGTQAVLDAMETASVPHIIYASTYAVYDWAGEQVVLTEASDTKPATVYGNSKLRSEVAIKEAKNRGAISRYHILRYGNIVGAVPQVPRHTPQNFIDKIMTATQTGETITVNGGDYTTVDGTVARDFIDIRDVADVNVRLLAYTESDTFNVSAGVATTLKQLITLCEHVSGNKVVVNINPRTGNEPASVIIENKHIAQALNFKPHYTLSDTAPLLLEKLTTGT